MSHNSTRTDPSASVAPSVAPASGSASIAPESSELRVVTTQPPPNVPSLRVMPDEKASGLHLRTAEVPVRWLDSLFVAACNMPVGAGERAVAESIVRALAEILPDRGVGACLAPPGETLQIVRYVPPGESQRTLGSSPTRLFVGFDAEIVLPVGRRDATLHLGVLDAEAAREGSPEHDLMRRAALALDRGLGVARSTERARDAARELRTLSSHMVQTEKLASLGQLAAGIVHELNNPLTSIVAYTDLLLKRQLTVGGEPQDVERLRRIGESAGRMLKFTRDLVTYAKPSRETAIAVSLHDVVDKALAFCEHVLDESRAKAIRDFAAESVHVRGMSEQLAQVFVNLVTNACHAMPPADGTLWVRTRILGSGEGVEVVVEDNGEGIAPEHLGLVFTPFFTTKGDGKGTGLGLSIVKNILDTHDAGVRIEARSGGGTRFVMVFARVEP